MHETISTARVLGRVLRTQKRGCPTSRSFCFLIWKILERRHLRHDGSARRLMARATTALGQAPRPQEPKQRISYSLGFRVRVGYDCPGPPRSVNQNPQTLSQKPPDILSVGFRVGTIDLLFNWADQGGRLSNWVGSSASEGCRGVKDYCLKVWCSGARSFRVQ